MFTGLVECVGTVASLAADGGGVLRIGVAAPEIAGELKEGESVSVSGACLTVVELGSNVFYAQIMPETTGTTRLASLGPGAKVNLERALRVSDRLDGHIVLGHVDAVTEVLRIEKQGDSSKTVKFWISMPHNLAWAVAPKGSIALDGISLTVIDSTEREFSVGLIPATLCDTSAGELKPGDEVNIEIDVMARYLARMLAFGLPDELRSPQDDSGLTWDRLSEIGWS